jgi:thioredoxin 1
VGKIDVDQEMELAMQFKIASIPTLVLMKNGTVTGTLIGYRPKADILKFIEA